MAHFLTSLLDIYFGQPFQFTQDHTLPLCVAVHSRVCDMYISRNCLDHTLTILISHFNTLDTIRSVLNLVNLFQVLNNVIICLYLVKSHLISP